LNRVWRLVVQNEELFKQPVPSGAEADGKTKELRRLLHQTIKKVTIEIGERNHFNTAVSAIMELVNGLYQHAGETDPALYKEALETLVVLLAPFVPHMSEELWSMMGKEGSVHQTAWPSYDESALILDEVELAVQINGKVREKIVVPNQASREEIEKQALDNERIKHWTEGKTVRKVIVVPGKLVNIVVK
jgi:leucyl-tRNA synthetase